MQLSTMILSRKYLYLLTSFFLLAAPFSAKAHPHPHRVAEKEGIHLRIGIYGHPYYHHYRHNHPRRSFTPYFYPYFIGNPTRHYYCSAYFVDGVYYGRLGQGACIVSYNGRYVAVRPYRVYSR